MSESFGSGLASGLHQGLSFGMQKNAVYRSNKREDEQDARLKKALEDEEKYKAGYQAIVEKWHPTEKAPKAVDVPIAASVGIPQVASPVVPDAAVTAPAQVQPVEQQPAAQASPVAAGIPAPKKDTTVNVTSSMNMAADLALYELKNGRSNGNAYLAAMKLQQAYKTEGATDAMELMHRGDFSGGLDLYNKIGTDSSSTIVGQPVKRETKIDGVTVPSYDVTIKNEKGTVVINTAEFLRASRKIDDVIKSGQEGTKQAETKRHNIATEDIQNKNSDNKLLVAEAKEAKGTNNRLVTNDGVGKIAELYGAKLDPVNKMLDTSTIKDQTGYYAAMDRVQKMVTAGTPVYEAVNSIAQEQLRNKAMQGGASQNAGAAKPYSTPWK